MFGLFKAKGIEVAAPATGEVVVLESVNDEVFSQKMAGDGIAIIPSDGLFGAPIDGDVIKIFSTGHAFVIRGEKGIEVMVHIGLDTVTLRGGGFSAVVSEGDRVKAGDIIVKADLKKISSLGKEIITPVIVSELGQYKSIDKKSGAAAKGDIVMEVK